MAQWSLHGVSMQVRSSRVLNCLNVASPVCSGPCWIVWTCYRRLYYLYPRWIFHCDAIPPSSSTIMDRRCVRIQSLYIMIPWSCNFQKHYNIQTDSKVLFSVEPPWPCFSKGNMNTLKFWKYTCNTRVGQYNCTACVMTVEKRISSFKKISHKSHKPYRFGKRRTGWCLFIITYINRNAHKDCRVCSNKCTVSFLLLALSGFGSFGARQSLNI